MPIADTTTKHTIYQYILNVGMLSGHNDTFWRYLLFLWIYFNRSAIRRTTTEHHVHSYQRWSHRTSSAHIYVEALIPVNNDGLEFIRSAMSSSIPQPWLRQQQPSDVASTTRTKTVIRIERTDESQLSDVASFLATASQQSYKRDKYDSNPWREKIDLLFAKSDIEALIRRRWRILDMGQKASIQAKMQLQLQQQQQQQYANSGLNLNQRLSPYRGTVQLDDDAILKYLWATNDELRNEIQLAASETGEDTVWLHHSPMIITPSSKEWLNHLQISAIATTGAGRPTATVDAKTASAFKFPFNFNNELKSDALPKVVGFCEVAMLSNPMYGINQTIHHSSIHLNAQGVISIPDRNRQCSDGTPHMNYYSPAIANLAVDLTMRRQGIATKLLQRAERYVSVYWTNTTTIGLYVASSNVPAIRLYEKFGFKKIMTVPSTSSPLEGNEENSRMMLYMSKQIRS